MGILIALAAALAIALVVVSVTLGNARKTSNDHESKIHKLEETIRVLQDEDIQVFIKHVNNVMAGEILIEDEKDLLWGYSYHKDAYPKMSSIESSFEVITAQIDGDRCEIVIAYEITYFNSIGKEIRYRQVHWSSSRTWILEKQNEKWILIEKNDGP